MSDKATPRAPDGVDPEQFLRKLLEISPEDAAEARDQAAKDAQGEGREGT